MPLLPGLDGDVCSDEEGVAWAEFDDMEDFAGTAAPLLPFCASVPIFSVTLLILNVGTSPSFPCGAENGGEFNGGNEDCTAGGLDSINLDPEEALATTGFFFCCSCCIFCCKICCCCWRDCCCW